ncbi:hypothetical protein CHU95_02935 [Niveispirillum lacus]|uniref:Uncharacterized protein n=1 Tax=Niveispirillum lacus TaxID=1981099 RepID=A0A255Z665_9PROT|nr:hypothetical protein [Niveispirillum lacus]OYQ36958.1 hypothetical protein CHU95_02935 [Niveispirillum lacus]
MENKDLMLDDTLHGEASLGDLLSDPIAVLLMNRDGVAAEDVLHIVRVTAGRIASNDCGRAAKTISAA